MSPGPADDFLPAARPADRVARRRARQIKQWAIAGAVVGAAVLVVVLIAVLGGDDSPSARVSTRGAHRRTDSTSTHRPRRTTTTSAGEAGTTASSIPPDGGTGSGSGGPVPPATASPGTTPPSTGANGGVMVTEDRGACTFDTTAEKLVDTGMLQNSGTEEAVAEVQVTWSDDTGELDSWTEVQSVPPGGSTAWSVSTAWPDQVQGNLRCEVTLI